MDIYGTNGNDYLTDTNADDRVFGLAGDDNIQTSYGADKLYGGDGNDQLYDSLGGMGTDADELYGGAGDDRLNGSGGKNKLYGEDGNDILSSGLDGEILNGGKGVDTVDYFTSGIVGQGVTVDLAAGTSKGANGNDTLISIENVIGSGDDDTIYGNSGNNIIYGGEDPFGDGGDDILIGRDGSDQLYGENGDDRLIGGNSKDILVGGFGDDILTGGSGNDRFVFQYPEEGIDTITDFSRSQGDAIRVSAEGFEGDLEVGALNQEQFRLGSSAQDGTDRFIYNRSIGALYFDVDGKGGAGQIQIATLSNEASLSYGNFVVTA
jgi:Ca2+-binding RTX toxin-like protein